MTISVIIPTLNTLGIASTLRALIEQEPPSEPYEIIVVGMDEPHLVFKHPLIHFDRTEKPLIPSKARNRGAQRARGDLLLFIDADCIPRPDWIKTIEQRFIDPGVSVLGGGVEFPERNYWNLADNLSMFYTTMAGLRPGQRSILPSLNFAIRKRVFDEMGGFDPDRVQGEDADLCLRLKARGFRLFFAPESRVIHAHPRNSLGHLFRHGYLQGYYSTKVDPRYRDNGEGLPEILRNRFVLTAASPFVALAVTLRIFTSRQALMRYWYTAPAVLLAKFAWCLGAANSPHLQPGLPPLPRSGSPQP